MSIADNQAWRDFFSAYERLPELWQNRSDGFKNQMKRRKAWDILLSVYKNIDPSATVEKLKQRINSIRTSYRREVRRSSSSNESYVSPIWYISHLHFLQEKEDGRFPISPSPNVSYVIKKKKKIKPSITPVKLRILQNPQPSVNNKTEVASPEQINPPRSTDARIVPTGKDEAEIYSESWACSYRKLSPTQQIFAKKAIDEILILGQLGQLDFETVKFNSYNSLTYADPRTVHPLSPSTGSESPSSKPSIQIIEADSESFDTGSYANNQEPYTARNY